MLILALRTGMFPSSLWTIGRSVWSQASVAYWILDFGGVWHRIGIRSMYVQPRYFWCRICHSHALVTTAAKALDVLRGLQGIGSAAIIPASVRNFLVLCSHILTFSGPPTSSEFWPRHSRPDPHVLSRLPLSLRAPRSERSFRLFLVVSLRK